MPPDESSHDDELLAPIDFLVVEFPDGTVTAEGFDRLLELVERRVIRVLDVEFISNGADGAEVVDVADVPTAPNADLSAWVGSSSGLLDADDIAMVGGELDEGSIAVVIVFENVWVLDLAANWSGARVIFDGGVATDDLIEALDAAEAN